MGTCIFCSSEALRVYCRQVFHPANRQHGPYDLYLCGDCGSLITHPQPEPEDLRRLYSGFNGGMIPEIRELRNEFPLKQWFRQCLENALAMGKISPGEITRWIDLGAGNGEMVVEMNQQFPDVPGLAMDFHTQPFQLNMPTRIQWLSEDLNLTGFSKNILPQRAELIFAITVIEHLLHPDLFIKESLTLLKKPGVFYLTTPRTDCLAFRLLGKSWPYFLPGEHIHIPSVKGMSTLLQKICNEIFDIGSFSVDVRPVILPYPPGYYLGFAGLNRMARWVGSRGSIRIPTGLLEAAVVLHPKN